MKSLRQKAEVDFMDYSNELLIWNSVSVSITNVKHGLLFRQAVSELFENSVFIYAVGKNAKIQIDDIPYRLKSNCLMHIGADKKITIDAIDEELEYFFVAYQAELLPDTDRKMMALLLNKKPFQQFYSLRTTAPAFFMEQFIIMSDEWNTGGPLSRIRLKACFYAVVHELYSELISGIGGQMEVDSFEYARHYIRQNYAQTSSIQSLAEALGITRAALHEQFKQNIGIGPQQYLMQLRLDAACRNLIGSSMTIDEIAASCGLRDKAYFSRVFKQKYGVSPGMFRKQYMAAKGNDAALYDRQIYSYGKRSESYVLIENMGRVHRYYGIPQRIVCLDYSAAEMCAALGLADKLVGVASAEGSLSDCVREHRPAIAKAPFLSGRSAELNVPSFETVLACCPDIVIGTGYSFNPYNGVASAEDFEQKGIHIYALKATCMSGCGFESVYEDIRNLGRIFGREQRADEIVGQMHVRENELELFASQYDKPVRVFSFDGVVSDRAFTCGQSLENVIIEKAGGINIFGGRKRQFVCVDWNEVAKEDPQAIIVHCFYTQEDGQQKVAFLKRIQEIRDTDAIRNNRFFVIGIKKVFPSVDSIETAYQFCQWLHS